jgi:hypothetical protein
MINRWILIPLYVVGLIACTDSTAPDSRTLAQRPLTLPEYALQLRGDPFLRSLSQMLGRPQLSEGIDTAVSGLAQGTTANGAATTAWLISTRTSLVPVFDESAEQAVTENDVLSAALIVTLDRVAQLNSHDGESTPAESDPPPSR